MKAFKQASITIQFHWQYLRDIELIRFIIYSRVNSSSYAFSIYYQVYHGFMFLVLYQKIRFKILMLCSVTQFCVWQLKGYVFRLYPWKQASIINVQVCWLYCQFTTKHFEDIYARKRHYLCRGLQKLNHYNHSYLKGTYKLKESS